VGRLETDTIAGVAMNTVILEDMTKPDPASNITYRIEQFGGIFYYLYYVVIFSFFLSPILSIISLVVSYANNWQSMYLKLALVFGVICPISLVVSIFLSLVFYIFPRLLKIGYYIDIGPQELYYSRHNITIKYDVIYEIVEYREQRYTGGHVVGRQGNYVYSTAGRLVPDPFGLVLKVEIITKNKNSICIDNKSRSDESGGHLSTMSTLIAQRVALAKGYRDYESLITKRT